MIDINKIKPSQLYNDEFQKDLAKETERITLHLQDKQAKLLADNLEKVLSGLEQDPGLKQDYQRLIARLRFVALPRLPFKEIIPLLKNNLTEVLEDPDLDVLGRLKLALIGINPWARDDIKKELITALRDNNQTLFEQEGIKDGKPVSIANCLKDYDYILGAQPVEKIKQTEYVVRNFSKLKLDRQEVVKKLLNIYEYLKITSKSPRAFEDDFIFMTDKGKMQDIKGDRLVDVKPPKKEKLTQEEIEFLKQNVLPNIKDPEEKKTFIKVSGLEDTAEEEEFFSEEELKELKEKQGPPPIDLSQAITNVMTKTELSFPDKVMKKRFQTIIESFLRDVRSEVETRIVLKRDQKIGGVGLDDETVDKVAQILNEVKPRVKIEIGKEVKSPPLAEGLKSPEELILTETRMTAPAPLSPSPVKEIKKQKQEKQELLDKLEDHPVEKKKPEEKEIDVKTKFQPETQPAPAPPKAEELRVEPKIEPEIRPPLRRQVPEPTKPVTEEVKVKPKIYGPVDEVRSITLVEWRRKGTTKDAVQWIQDKINLLGEESLTKKAEAIKAWKESEINKMYLGLGEESINKGKSVSEVIKDRQQQDQTTLTQQEFDAVVELNEKLRF